MIGSGFGGLASAALLAKEGHNVTVLEKNEQPGGRASTLHKDGFRFEMGPSWYMMPDVFEKYFAEFGKKVSDFYALTRLSPKYKVFFEDKSSVVLSDDLQKTIELFESWEKGAGEKFKQYLAISQKKYEIAMEHVMYRNIDSFFDFARPPLMINGLQLGIVESMHHHIAHFFKHPKIQQILEYNLVFLGCSPKKAPALFSLMTHVDFNLGVWYPEGGITAVVQALEKLGKEQGVKYVYNEPVIQLETSAEKIRTVVTSKQKYKSDIVISNADYVFTEQLLPPDLRMYSDAHWKKKVWAPSAFLLYLGVKGKLPDIAHHTLYFGNDWAKHFADIFDHHRWPVDPSIYINKPSETDPTVAPKGHETLMVLVPIAPGLEENHTWKKMYAEYVISFIEEKIGISLKKNIVTQEIFSVSDFESRYNSYQGNALGGLAHTLFQSSLWRPNNFSDKVKNLFYAGANTVPGIGVPPAIISAHLVRDRIRETL